MQFEGEMHLPQPPAQVWQRLTDVRFLLASIPEAQEVKEATEDRGVCVIKPGFSFVRGTLELTVERLAAEPPTSAAFRLVSKGIGSSSEVHSQLALAEQDGGTRVNWKAEVVNLGGLLKAVPKGLIRGAAHKTIDNVWAAVAKRLGGTETDKT